MMSTNTVGLTSEHGHELGRNLDIARTACDMRTYKAEVIQSVQSLRAVDIEWKRFLSEGAIGHNFDNDPDNIELQSKLRPELTPWILVLRRGGRICCIAPFHRENTRRSIQFSVFNVATLPVRMLSLIGGQFIIAADEDHYHCYSASFKAIRECCLPLDLILLEDINTASSLWRFCSSKDTCDRHFRFLPASSDIDTLHQIRFPDSHDLYMSSLSPKTRQNLRRTAKKLTTKHNVRLETITGAEQVPHFLNQLDEVFRQTWQAKVYGYRPRNTEAEIDYFSAIAKRGWLRSYLLINDREPLAYEFAVQYDGIFLGQECGYAQSWADYGPGSVMTHLFLKHLFYSNPPRLVSFGRGNQAYKRTFGNTAEHVATLYATPPNLWRYLLTLQSAIFVIERLARSVFVWLNLDSAVRKILKHKA